MLATMQHAWCISLEQPLSPCSITLATTSLYLLTWPASQKWPLILPMVRHSVWLAALAATRTSPCTHPPMAARAWMSTRPTKCMCHMRSIILAAVCRPRAVAEAVFASAADPVAGSPLPRLLTPSLWIGLFPTSLARCARSLTVSHLGCPLCNRKAVYHR
jgi:hypothetical protein